MYVAHGDAKVFNADPQTTRMRVVRNYARDVCDAPTLAGVLVLLQTNHLTVRM